MADMIEAKHLIFRYPADEPEDGKEAPVKPFTQRLNISK